MSIWIDIASGGYEIGKELGLWKKLRSLLRKKKKILLIGASGAGKTQFIESIKNVLSPRLTQLQRTIELERRKVTIDGYPFLLIDTPGQKLDEAKRKKAINEAIATKMEGFINIVCYGYHEAAEADKSQAIGVGCRTIADPTYLKERRQVELDLLSEWVPHVIPETARWVLTVVTKADLWWPDTKRQIQRYYEQGPYAKVIESTGINHAVVPYCSVIEPFYGIRTGGSFGDNDRDKLRQNLLECLIRLTGVER